MIRGNLVSDYSFMVEINKIKLETLKNPLNPDRKVLLVLLNIKREVGPAGFTRRENWVQDLTRRQEERNYTEPDFCVSRCLLFTFRLSFNQSSVGSVLI